MRPLLVLAALLAAGPPARAAEGKAPVAAPAAAAAAAASATAAAVSPAAVVAPAAAPPVSRVLSESDLGRLQGDLLSGDATRRLRAAETIAAADPEGFPTYSARLLREVPGDTRVIQRLIHAIWGQYPNPEYPRGPGKDPPMWFTRPEPPIPPGTPRTKRPKPHDPDAADWLSGLAQLDLEHDELLAELPPELTPQLVSIRGEVLLRVALLRAVAGAGKAGVREAIHTLFQFAFVRDGLFRDECGRSIRSMGSHAVPGLIRIYNDRTRANAKMRRYASYQLDRMDRLRPSKAISSAPDELVRADIIHAYGEVLALDAVEAVLDQVAAKSHRVRREARWAWLRYVDGPPPPPAPKRKRKLPGGKEEAEEKEDYLNYREMATLTLQHKLQELTGQAPDAALSAKQMTDQLFALHDREEEQLFQQLFDSAKAHERAGRIQQAVDEFGWILANQPDHPRRAEMADVFRRHGERMAQEGEERGDWDLAGRGIGWLRQALALRPDLPGANKIRARIHLLDGKQAQRRGGDGREDFAQALHEDPSLTEAQQALQATAPQPGQKRLGLFVLLGVGLLVLLVAALLWRRLPRGV
ncbi:MAG: hypothetical protein U1A78_27915 [Polyangia bacterium]